MSLSNAPRVEDILVIAPTAHRSVAYGGLDPDHAWMVLVRTDLGWGLYGTRRCERDARIEASKQQHRTAGVYAVMAYKALADYDRRILRAARSE